MHDPCIDRRETTGLGERADALERFQNNRFGIFVTWTLFSGLYERKMQAGGWGSIMQEEMRTGAIARQWDARADAFDADTWARTFKEAGARYVIFVPSHALDFALLNTRQTNYKSQRDYTGELAQACARYGLDLCIYVHLATGLLREYNHLLGRDNLAFGRVRVERGAAQDAYLDTWLTELCRQYRPRAIWLDGWTGIARAIAQTGADPLQVYDFSRIARTIHACDPDILVGNKLYLPSSTDYRVTDHLFWDNSCLAPLDNSVPSECSDVLPGNIWEAKYAEQTDFLSPSEIAEQTQLYIKRMLTAFGRGVNYALNVGPLPNGELQRVEATMLQGIGRWLAVYGETLFATRPEPVECDWGYVLRKGPYAYAHIVDTGDIGRAQGFPLDEDSPAMCRMVERARKRGAPANGRIRIERMSSLPSQACLMSDDGTGRLVAERKLPMARLEHGVEIDLAGVPLNALDTVLRLTL